MTGPTQWPAQLKTKLSKTCRPSCEYMSSLHPATHTTIIPILAPYENKQGAELLLKTENGDKTAGMVKMKMLPAKIPQYSCSAHPHLPL